MSDVPLTTLLGDLLITAVNVPENFQLHQMPQTDSRKVMPGDIFAAVPGTKVDGKKFIPQAVAAKCGGIIHQDKLTVYPADIPCFQVTDVRKAVARCCRRCAGEPDQELTIFGVTGTNGKTTSAYLLRHLLNNTGNPCGLISTVEYDIGSAEPRHATHTTPDPELLFPALRAMADNGRKFAAMEFSSHALAQHRVAGVRVCGAVFSNLTGDHLDFHHDTDSYFAAKEMLFTEYLVPDAPAVINIDDPAGEKLAANLVRKRPDLRICRFAAHHPAADYRITEAVSDTGKCSFTLILPDRTAMPVSFPLPGSYNISNLAGVLILLLNSGINPVALSKALTFPLQIPGRLEHLSVPGGADFFIDFAHTDDAVINVLKTLKPLAKGRLMIVFGAGGDRDRTKRPRMGKAAAMFADRIFITSDNPRSEDPEEIIADILSGITDGTASVQTEVDRRKALAAAVRESAPGDIIVIAGKGHESTQEIAGVKHHFNDREELLKLLSAGEKI